MSRTLPEIARTRLRDVARHAELLSMARMGEAGEKEIGELSVIDRDLHVFDRMCRRWAPLSLTELGFTWGETLTHEQDPDARLIVRECALVERAGETMDLAEATRRLSPVKGGASIGGWRGSVGAVGDLAGLRPAKAMRGEQDDWDVLGIGHGGEVASEPGADLEHDLTATSDTTAVTYPGDDQGVCVPPRLVTQTAESADAVKSTQTTRKKTARDNYDLFG